MTISTTPCPWCNGTLMVSEATTFRPFLSKHPLRGEAPEMRPVETVVIACNGCEFVREVDADERPKVPNGRSEWVT